MDQREIGLAIHARHPVLSFRNLAARPARHTGA
jgi:hypothetical protein